MIPQKLSPWIEVPNPKGEPMTATEPKRRTLFEITAGFLRYAALLTEPELTAEQVAELETFEADFATAEGEKLDGYYNVHRTLQMEAAAAREQAERWQREYQCRESADKRLLANVKRHLEATGQTKVTSTSGYVFSICGNGGKIPIEIDPGIDVDALPDSVVKRVPDADKLRSELEAGKKFAFARLKDRGTHLRVK